MPTYPWRRLRSTHAPCVARSESGVNYTSHHLRCGQIHSAAKQSSCQQRLSSSTSSSAWPGTPPVHEEEYDSFSNVFTPQNELQYTHVESSSKSVDRPTKANVRPSATLAGSIRPIRRPPQCKLPASMRFTTLILYITIALLFVCSTNAAPLLTSETSLLHEIQRRQAIPDKFGRTGNEPAPVFTPSPPSTINSTIQTAIPSSAPIPSETVSPPSQPSTPFTGANGNANTNPQNDLDLDPSAPTRGLTLTSTNFPMSPGAIAGIAGGSVVFLLLIGGAAAWAYRRHRRVEVNEIPIRRSRLGSRLAHRFLGDAASRGPSRSGSRGALRRGSDESEGNNEKQVEAGWLDKGSISRPKNTWLENGLLTVPKPGFMRQQKEDDVAPWVIGNPRPARPASAEPLGRLSGMGLGMGYLK